MLNIDELRQKKKELKLTTADIAYNVELPVSTVSKIMTGETKNPSYITIEKIHDFICREEMKTRLIAYIETVSKYLDEHPDEDVDQKAFYIEYTKKHPFHDFAGGEDREKPVEGHSIWENLALDHVHKTTIKDFADLGETRNIELLDGYFIVNQSPKLNHHILVKHIGSIIDRFIEDNRGKCMMFNTGVGVFIDSDEFSCLIPDICVLCDNTKLVSEGIVGAPDWVIEVTSPGTARNDYTKKMHKYMSAGVREYWIVDPDKETVTVHIEGMPMVTHLYGFDDEIPVYIYDGKLKISMRVHDIN